MLEKFSVWKCDIIFIKIYKPLHKITNWTFKNNCALFIVQGAHMNKTLTSVNIDVVSQTFGQSSEMRSTHQNKETLRIICSQTHFFIYSFYVRADSILQICIWEDTSNIKCNHPHLKMDRHFTNAILILPKHSQPPWDICKCATVYDRNCSYVHLFRWRKFWAFVVNFDLTINCSSKDLMFCWPFSLHQYRETNVMHFLFNLLRIKDLYMFRALPA
jgi:hypothetical protein